MQFQDFLIHEDKAKFLSERAKRCLDSPFSRAAATDSEATQSYQRAKN